MLYGKGNYDLKANYDRFNKKLFNGELPEVDIFWEDGLEDCHANVFTDVCSHHYKHGDPIRLGVSPYYATKRKKSLDSIIIHEMIHVWEIHVLGCFTLHKLPFKCKAAELMCKYNCTIENSCADPWNFVYVGRGKTVRPILIYECDDGEFVWIPISHNAIDMFYEQGMKRAKEKGLRHGILELSRCRVSNMTPRKIWPDDVGYKFVKGLNTHIFGNARIKFVGGVGLSEKEVKKMMA